MKNVKTLMVAALVFAAAFAVVPSQAEAACSYPGYINSNGKCVVSYKNTYQNRYTYSYNDDWREKQIDLLQAYIQRLNALIAQLEDMDGDYYRPYGQVLGYSTSRYSDVDVTTRSATDIDDEEATLRGRVDFNNEDEATVYFQYGRTSSNLSYETTHFVLDEDDDDEYFEHTITNLRDDTKYYFRAVAEDEEGDRDYGSVLSFTTDDSSSSNNDDEPDRYR